MQDERNMTETVWESRDWTARLAFCRWLPFAGVVVGILGFALFVVNIGRISPGLFGGLFLMVVGFLMTFFFIFNMERIYWAGKGKSLAVLDRNGKIDWSGLKKVYLKPWPFKSYLRVVNYPTEFIFSTSLRPITSNPKVLPFDVSVKVKFEGSGTIPLHFTPHFRDFLSDPGLYNQEFYKNAFEVLQHDLPQELVDRLNPYDSQTVNEFTAYVTGKLQGKLPFKHDIYCTVDLS